MRTLSPIPFTKEGYNKLKREYEELFKERPQAVATLKQARELGDLRENGLYRAARSRLSSIDSRLERLHFMIKLGFVQDISKETISIGSKVKVFDGEHMKVFYIVGNYESDPTQNKISTSSPIGTALVGKSVGDEIEIRIPVGKVIYKIVSVTS